VPHRDVLDYVERRLRTSAAIIRHGDFRTKPYESTRSTQPMSFAGIVNHQSRKCRITRSAHRSFPARPSRRRSACRRRMPRPRLSHLEPLARPNDGKSARSISDFQPSAYRFESAPCAPGSRVSPRSYQGHSGRDPQKVQGGYPGLFGAYNAGAGAYAAFLAGRKPLPSETIAYLASVGSAVEPAAKAPGTAPPPSLFIVRRNLAADRLPAGRAEEQPLMFAVRKVFP